MIAATGFPSSSVGTAAVGAAWLLPSHAAASNATTDRTPARRRLAEAFTGQAAYAPELLFSNPSSSRVRFTSIFGPLRAHQGLFIYIPSKKG
jgi:hypothetical protein